MEKNFLLVLFYSASGSVKNLAHAIADGIEETEMNVRIRTVPKVSAKSELENFFGISKKKKNQLKKEK